jgi:hypothetical protein
MDATTLANQVAALQDSSGCWNVLSPSDNHYPELNYYVPNYKSTLWTLVLLADSLVDPGDERFKKPLETITEHFFDPGHGIFSIGKSHFPIPCLNGNMLYLLAYFRFPDTKKTTSVVDFFGRYQRFDDGDFATPTKFPYYSNKSCYGRHTCYWGVVKLLKGLVHLPEADRGGDAESLISRCVDFILLHEVCFSSRRNKDFLHKGIESIAFPHMYRSDFLEILWILTKAGVRDKRMDRAINLLKSKTKEDGEWSVDKRTSDLIVPFGKPGIDRKIITARARDILRFHEDHT